MAKREKQDDLIVMAVDGYVVLTVRGIEIWMDEEAAGDVVESILLALEAINRNNGGLYVNN